MSKSRLAEGQVSEAVLLESTWFTVTTSFAAVAWWTR